MNSEFLFHCHFYDLPRFLKKGDVLVFNDTKVFPARLLGRKASGGKIEVLLLEPADPTLPPKADPPGAGKRGEKEAQISALLKPGKNAVGQTIRFSPQLTAQVTRRAGEIFTLQFNRSGRELTTLIDSLGIAPTPPYIKTVSNLKEYQTIYARHRGSVAAPTAGFHFTKPLLASLKKQGVQFEYVTLHVGLGTFQPVKETLVEHHRMHYESYSVCPATWRRLQTARQEGRRIIAVGTTTCRVLETISSSPALRPGLGPHLLHGTTDIFITPGYHFKMTDALITNFHLPQSTLLMLISAFLSDKFNNSKLGIKLTKEIYREAIGRKYRFYSFGDAMLII